MKFVDHLNERSAANKYAGYYEKNNFTAILRQFSHRSSKTSGDFTFQSFFLGDFAIKLLT